MDKKDQNMSSTASIGYNSDDDGIDVEHNPVSRDSSDEQDEVPSGPTVTKERTTKANEEESDANNIIDFMGRRFSMIGTGGELSLEDTPIVRIPPKVNCQEKIIICLDMSREMDDEEEAPFKLGDGSAYSPLAMAKRVIEMFVNTKNRMDRKHEYALVLLYDTPTWVNDFTSDPKEISNLLSVATPKLCKKLNLSSLFELIESKVVLPNISEPEVNPPPYVIRTILIYGRSTGIPEYSTDKEAFQRLFQSHYFFLDVFYIHATTGKDNKCQDIFDALCDLDERGTSYIVEVSRNPTKLHDCMAKLLAHPLQRPIQREVNYRLDDCDG